MFTAIGSVVGVLGAVAAAGATASVCRGFARGVGRLCEGDPMAALKEVGGGFVEPAAIAGTQIVNLVHDAANVVVYAGASAAGFVSEKARGVVAQIGGFDNTIAALVLAHSLPELPGGPPAARPVPVAVAV